MSGGEEWEPAEQIDDPEEYSQTQRIRELLQRRAHALDVGEEAARAIISGDLEREKGQLVFLHAIRSLILDLYTKLDGVEDDDGNSYLREQPIGEITVDVPPGLPQSGRDRRLAPGGSTPEPETVEVEGLQWFVAQNFPLRVTFSVRTLDGKPGVDRQSVDVYPPMELLYSALVACEEAMDQLGIDVEIKAEDYTGQGDPGL